MHQIMQGLIQGFTDYDTWKTTGVILAGACVILPGVVLFVVAVRFISNRMD